MRSKRLSILVPCLLIEIVLVFISLHAHGRHEGVAADPPSAPTVAMIAANPDLKLTPGMYADVTFALQQKTGAMIVPASAIIQGDQPSVMLVDSSNRVLRRSVVLSIAGAILALIAVSHQRSCRRCSTISTKCVEIPTPFQEIAAYKAKPFCLQSVAAVSTRTHFGRPSALGIAEESWSLVSAESNAFKEESANEHIYRTSQAQRSKTPMLSINTGWRSRR